MERDNGCVLRVQMFGIAVLVATIVVAGVSWLGASHLVSLVLAVLAGTIASAEWAGCARRRI
jgi:Flp pilus assembly protein TadB